MQCLCSCLLLSSPRTTPCPLSDCQPAPLAFHTVHLPQVLSLTPWSMTYHVVAFSDTLCSFSLVITMNCCSQSSPVDCFLNQSFRFYTGRSTCSVHFETMGTTFVFPFMFKIEDIYNTSNTLFYNQHLFYCFNNIKCILYNSAYTMAPFSVFTQFSKLDFLN